MSPRREGTLVALGLVAGLTIGAAARAQDAFQEDLRFQPFVYGALGGFPSGAGGGMSYGFGGGLTWLAHRGFGLGGDLTAFGNGAYAGGVASVDVSYHFVRGANRAIPFVLAGIGSGGVDGGRVTIASFGAGLNLWNLKGAAIRFEVRDRFPAEGGDHHISAPFGVTF